MSTPNDFSLKFIRLARFEGRRVPEVDLWIAGASHVFRRVSGILDSGSSETVIRSATAKLLDLPRLGSAIARTTVSGTVNLTPTRLVVRAQPDGEPPLYIPLTAYIADPRPWKPGLSQGEGLNLFGADLFNIFSIRIDRHSVEMSL